MVHVTDCKSLFDLVHKRGTMPSEKRLLLDKEAIREQISDGSLVSKWCSTHQILVADSMTKKMKEEVQLDAKWEKSQRKKPTILSSIFEERPEVEPVASEKVPKHRAESGAAARRKCEERALLMMEELKELEAKPTIEDVSRVMKGWIGNNNINRKTASGSKEPIQK